MRLDKYLCEAGIGTRSQVKELIRKGAVTVNGEKALRPEQKVEQEEVAVSGQKVFVSEFEYWMLHKPAGVISATEDRKLSTVLDLLPKEARKDLFPAGRLDRDTEGLLLLTNDGKLAHYLLSPKRHVDKVYEARVRGSLTGEHVKAFQEGLDIGDEKKTLPAELELIDQSTGADKAPVFRIRVTIREGRYHQVKRMFEAVGAQVLYLKRLSMGSLKLDEKLAPGESRRLTEEELYGLKEETGCWKG